MEFSRIFNLRLIIFALFMIAASLLIFVSQRQVFSQSGRGSPDRKKKSDKSRLPDPPPIRVPERGSQDSGVTFRINSDLVTVVTTISRRSPKDRYDLSREDFEILEDGVPQEIANFSRDAEQPLKLIMLFDTSLSVMQKINFERRAAAKFFERVMRPQDRGALIAFSSDVEVLQGFTSNVPLLVDAMKHLWAQGSTSLYDAVFLASDYIKPVPGRRVIVVVSDGGDTTSQKTLREALASAQRSDVMIFAVFTGNHGFSENLRDLVGERALETLTSETGGIFYRPLATPGIQGEETDEQSIRELDRAFNDLAEQVRWQYTLGYYSTNDKRDGSFRKLAIRIKKPGYTARARLGYYAAKG
jgi:Ca-activated chloride channel family protein